MSRERSDDEIGAHRGLGDGGNHPRCDWDGAVRLFQWRLGNGVKAMSSKCPDCGRENVSAPAGFVVLCGRRCNDYWSGLETWQERMWVADQCRKAGERALESKP